MLVLSGLCALGQELTLITGSDLNIAGDAQLYISGIELIPNDEQIITGPNEFIVKDQSLNELPTISKIYEISNPIKNFIGNINFHYNTTDLNNLEVEELTLYLKDEDAQWKYLDSDLDQVSMKLRYEFATPTDISGLTAGNIIQTLSSNDPILLDATVFPNPVISALNIDYPNSYRVELYNLLGGKIMEGSSLTTINFSNYASGTYILKITDSVTDLIGTYKVVKQ